MTWALAMIRVAYQAPDRGSGRGRHAVAAGSQLTAGHPRHPGECMKETAALERRAVLVAVPTSVAAVARGFHKMDRRDFAAEIPLEWALKDVDLAIGAARGATPPLLAALSSQWHAAVAAGHGRQDISAARLALGNPSHQS